MGSRLTNLLLVALLIVCVFGFALYQHEARKTQRLLGDMLAAFEESRPPTRVVVERPSPGGQTAEDPASPSDTASAASSDDAGDADAASSKEPSGASGRGGDDSTTTAVASASNDDGTDAQTREAGSDRGPTGDEAADDDGTGDGDDGASTSTASADDRRQGNTGETMAGDEPAQDGSAMDDRAEAAREKAWAAHEPLAREVLGELFAGEYEQVAARFTGDLADALTPARLSAVMDPIRERRGGLKSIGGHSRPRVALEPGVEAFEVTAITEQGEPMQFIITFDHRVEDGPSVSGLIMK